METESNCNETNKENKNQGNSEIAIEDVLQDEQEFEDKYLDLQRQWLEGHQAESELDAQKVAKFGEHSYILQYIKSDNEEGAGDQGQDRMVFHPTYSYSYTNYEKDCVLPLLSEQQLLETQRSYQSHIDRLEKSIFSGLRIKQQELDAKQEEKEREEEEADSGGWVVPPYCIPIRADIRKFDFVRLAAVQKETSGRLFDVIMMDPPWQLATANPTRGVALGYSQLGDNIISSIPVSVLQDNGLLFVWVINAKYRLALHLFKVWGYKMIADVAWVKQTVNRRIANGHGFYLQHAKETCLIGLKGDITKIASLNNQKIKGICSDIIYSERRGQSQKPEEIYQYIEQLVPNGFYMEIFGRRNNLRNGWLTIGNEL